MVETLDKRLHAYRDDLADEALRGRVTADRYTAGAPGHVTAAATPLRREPRSNAPMDTELLFGEPVKIFETTKDGWHWVQSQADGYVGYAAGSSIQAGPLAATHKVSVPGTFVYTEPDIKSPPLCRLSMGARLKVTDRAERFSRLQNEGWIVTQHLISIATSAQDHATLALQFLGVPYLWGGRSSLGLDCSGLVQITLDQCGKSVLRDTDMQAGSIGALVPFDGDEGVLMRGDLVFWPGHVGIWVDDITFVHANATDMAVSRGPLREVATRIQESTGDTISVVRRP